MSTNFCNALEALARFYMEARGCRICEMVTRRTECANHDMHQIEQLVLPLAEGELGDKLPPVLRDFMRTGPGEL